MDFSISAISPLGGVTDKQTFGAAVVSKTLDYMNQSMYASYAPGGGYGPSQAGADYGFQTTVLSAYGMSGALANFKV